MGRMLTLFIGTGVAASVLFAVFVVHELRDAARRRSGAPAPRRERSGRWRYEATVAK